MHLPTTKGGRPRTAYLHSNACRTLAAWMEVRGPHRFVITPVTRGGRIVPDRGLSAHQFWKIDPLPFQVEHPLLAGAGDDDGLADHPVQFRVVAGVVHQGPQLVVLVLGQRVPGPLAAGPLGQLRGRVELPGQVPVLDR